MVLILRGPHSSARESIPLASILRVLGLDPATAGVLLVIFLLLSGATAVRGLRLARTPGPETRRAWRSLGTWWVFFMAVFIVVALGRPAVALTMFGVSLLLLRESLRLVRAPSALPALTLLGGAVYGWGWLEWESTFAVVLPAASLLLLAAWVARFRRTVTHSRRAFEVFVAFFMAVVGPSFVLGTASLPAGRGPGGNGEGWFLALVVLTELNDIAQAFLGRAVGKRQLAPVLSPGKTWEGALGGVLATSILALVLLPRLTPVGRVHPFGLPFPVPPWIWAPFLGTVIAAAGIGGDLSASHLKRKRGVKDAGDLLPAHGGLLDRFDSLSVAAPVFFMISYLLWIRAW